MQVLKYDAFNKVVLFKGLNESDTQDDSNNDLMKEIKRDVSRCITVIVSQYPFFGEYIIGCRFLYDAPGVDTMATDGKNIFINTRFAAKLTERQMIFILCHEVMHIMMTHFARMNHLIGSHPSRGEMKKWNVAADYEINPILCDEGLLTPDELVNVIKGLYKEEYVKLSAETIFRKLGDDSGDDEEGEAPEMVARVGDVVYTKNGEWGQIEHINSDGSYDIKTITKDEADDILNSSSGYLPIM